MPPAAAGEAEEKEEPTAAGTDRGYAPASAAVKLARQQ